MQIKIAYQELIHSKVKQDEEASFIKAENKRIKDENDRLMK